MKLRDPWIAFLTLLLSGPLVAQKDAPPPNAFPTSPYDPVAPVVREKALDWIRTNARPFEGHLDQPAAVRPLLDKLDGARVIGLGELSHGDRESALTKIAIAKGLIEQKGIRLVGIEASIGSSAELDQFILDRRRFSTVAEERQEAERILLQAAVYDIWQSEPFRDFLIWLRQFNLKAERPVHFANFDGSEPSSDTRMIIDFIRRHASEPQRDGIFRQLQEIESALSPLLSPEVKDAYDDYLPKQTKASVLEHASQIKKLDALFASVAASDPGSEDRQLAMSAVRQFYETTAVNRAGRSIEDGLKDLFGGNTNNSGLRNRVTRRDRAMAETVLRILKQRPGERLILFAHNAHMERNGLDGLDFASYALSMGSFLQAELEDAYTVVNFVTAGGSYTASYTAGADGSVKVGRVEGPIAENPYSLGAFYRKVGSARFWLDLRDMPGVEPWAVSWRSYPFVSLAPGNTYDPDKRFYPTAKPVAIGTDITIFFDRVSPTQRLNKPGKTN